MEETQFFVSDEKLYYAVGKSGGAWDIQADGEVDGVPRGVVDEGVAQGLLSVENNKVYLRQS